MDILYAVFIAPFVDMATDPIFFIEVIVGGLIAGVMYSLVALGFVLIFKASGVFNFAQGILALFAGLTLVSVLEFLGQTSDQQLPWYVIVLAIICTAAVMVALAFAIERIVLRPLVNQEQIILFMSTIGLALFLTFFIMAPVFDQVYLQAVTPYLDEEMGAKDAIENAEGPFRSFMLAQTRESDIALFANISGNNEIATPDDIPFAILVPAFVTSELKTAFQIGFLIFIPFLIIDLVVASVLMAMGMMMLSPMIISLPFKIMLFVLVDGWAMIIGTLAASFYVN